MCRLTWADDPYIFAVAAVIGAEGFVIALENGRFLAAALYVVQPDVALSLPEKSRSFGRESRATLQFPARHFGIGEAPVVVTHRPPLVVVEDLHSTRAARCPRQPYLLTAWVWNK